MGRHDVLEIMERLRKYTTIFYSTHILDDVQRVSDTVAILNKGQLVAQAPIEQLLAGSGGITYNLKLDSGVDAVRNILQAQPWVKSLSQTSSNGVQSLSISVSDEAVAKDQLLRLALSDPSVSVVEFGRQKQNLEEVFLAIVEGGQNGQ
jgi:ABC-2 type transport system ATP-binding protein